MGAWSSFVLSVDTLMGLSPIDWPGTSIQGSVDLGIVQQAKQLCETMTTARIPSAIGSAGGSGAFFDSAVGVPALATDLQHFVGLAYLYRSWSDSGDRPGPGASYAKKAQSLMGTAIAPGELALAAKAFAGLAPILIGQRSKVPGAASGASLASVVDRYSATT